MTNATQGPMTARQLCKVLAKADNQENDYATTWGRKTSDRYYRAWVWVATQTPARDQFAFIPHKGYWESWELGEIFQTIQRVTDLVALDDNA